MEKEAMNMIHEIYQHFGDEQSKKIFGGRMMYSLTYDKSFLREMIESIPEVKIFFESLKENEQNEIVLFGAGSWAKYMLSFYPDLKFDCLVDNNKTLFEFEDGLSFPVIGFDELCENKRNATVIITTRMHNEEIAKQLKRAGFKNKQIINMGQMLNDLFERQYFDLPYLEHDEHEIFVDAGCFDASTSNFFSEWSKGKYDAIYAFEPDYNNYQKCKVIFDNELEFSEIYNIGLWNKHDTLKFDNSGKAFSQICENGEMQIATEALDVILKNVKVTFIKMDIEGAEYKALLGCKKIITECRPKMAVSIYHKIEDIWKIPTLLLKLNPEYKFYLRHYSPVDSETILYAI